MLNEKEFSILTKSSESTTLDFKGGMYELDDKKDIKGLSKFVKDIICFSNTIRNETSHIIVGIAELDDGSKELKGLDKSYDDAFFQDKIKDKVYPRPNFLYYQVEHQGHRFGIFEFPVTRYSTPISSVVALKGLEIGRVYYRHGTTNSEAIGQDVIRISDWLRSIPEEPSRHESLNDKLSNILGRLSDGTEKLSVIFPELLNISRTHELSELKDFCTVEITGFKGNKSEAERNEYKYRIQPVLIAPFRIELNPYSFVKATPHSVKNEMKQNENFFDYRMFFAEM